MKYTYVFVIYMGLEQDDLVEIKVQANSQNEAISKVKMILGTYIDIQVTGLYLNDWYES